MKDVKVLKTVGGYIAVQESPVDAMIRNLAAKVGLHVGADKLELINEPLGYPVLYAPISIFRWKVDNKPQAKCPTGLRLIEIALVEALRMVRQRLLFDASTSEPIVDLAIDLGFFA